MLYIDWLFLRLMMMSSFWVGLLLVVVVAFVLVSLVADFIPRVEDYKEKVGKA